MIATTTPDEREAVTRVGGRPLVPPDFEWPHCIQCREPMHFLCQARLQDADEAMPDRILLLLMCGGDDCPTWEPLSGANHAVCVPSTGLVLAQSPVSPREIDGVKLVPFEADLGADFEGESYEQAREKFEKKQRHVLGHVGDPAGTVSTDGPPRCKQCRTEMRFIVHLEEDNKPDSPINFGGGSAFAYVCPTCWEQGAFLWEQ